MVNGIKLSYSIDPPQVRPQANLGALEDAIRELPIQIDPEELTTHHFAPGLYLRELFIPAGTVLTGKIHRFETMNILLKGSIRVTTDNGMKTLDAPQIFNSKPGTKKAGFAITDTTWLNVHPTEETDLKEIEREFIIPEHLALGEESSYELG